VRFRSKWKTHWEACGDFLIGIMQVSPIYLCKFTPCWHLGDRAGETTREEGETFLRAQHQPSREKGNSSQFQGILRKKDQNLLQSGESHTLCLYHRHAFERKKCRKDGGKTQSRGFHLGWLLFSYMYIPSAASRHPGVSE
jgi:hypothetical protein